MPSLEKSGLVSKGLSLGCGDADNLADAAFEKDSRQQNCVLIFVERKEEPTRKQLAAVFSIVCDVRLNNCMSLWTIL